MSERELDDHLQITRLLYLYARAIDSKDFALFDRIFAPEAVIHYDVDGGTKLPVAEMKQWLGEVLQGAAVVRPHLQIRMPKFAGLDSFAKQLVAADSGGAAKSEQQVFGDFASLAPAGRALLDVGCVQCHPLRGEHLPGVLGVDLHQPLRRLQPEWFREFMRDPARLKPRTRMPTFFPKGKSSSLRLPCSLPPCPLALSLE